MCARDRIPVSRWFLALKNMTDADEHHEVYAYSVSHKAIEMATFLTTLGDPTQRDTKLLDS